jgi:hypothetical protein
LHASEAPADEAKAKILVSSLDTEYLQDGAPGDDGLDICTIHGDAADAKLTEMGEAGAAR